MGRLNAVRVGSRSGRGSMAWCARSTSNSTVSREDLYTGRRGYGVLERGSDPTMFVKHNLGMESGWRDRRMRWCEAHEGCCVCSGDDGTDVASAEAEAE